MKRIANWNWVLLLGVVAVLAATLGCKEPKSKTAKKKPVPTAKGILGKKDKVSEFDPSAADRISDSQAKPANPLNPLGAMKSYGPAVEQISKQHIQRALMFFHAEEGRYPRDFEEFMERVIKPNRIELPKLPGGAKYQYDVDNHKLVVVKKK